MTDYKKTKIVATLGPATDSKEILTNLAQEGVNVFRINFSHADYDNVKKTVKTIREINEENGFNVAILADLQGPKLRVGVMEDGVILEDGALFTFTTEKCIGTKEKAFMTYQRFPKDVKVGEQIMVDDGKLLFEVVSTDKDKEVVVNVIVGGPLNSKKRSKLTKYSHFFASFNGKRQGRCSICIGFKCRLDGIIFCKNSRRFKNVTRFNR